LLAAQPMEKKLIYSYCHRNRQVNRLPWLISFAVDWSQDNCRLHGGNCDHFAGECPKPGQVIRPWRNNRCFPMSAITLGFTCEVTFIRPI
jgi:hypothetical protein